MKSLKPLSDEERVIGSMRQFGEDGPAYEILSLIDFEHVTIKVLETGEELSYPLKQAMGDPLDS